jgi:MYXO-CTERM domain-containing protein
VHVLHIWPLAAALASPPMPAARDSAPPRPRNSAGAGVYGGQPTGESSTYDATVHILAGTQACSGVAVSPRLVLTAAHCLQADLPADAIEIRFGAEPFSGGSRTTAERYAPHPDYCDDCDEDAHDIGWIVTADTIVVDYPTVISDQREYRRAIGTGQSVVVVGYGETDDGQSTASYPIRYAASVEIREVTDSGAEFFAGGDGVDTCRGDSGGPAFVSDEAGRLRLVGVTSRGTTECGGGGYYTAPLPELCWVRDSSGEDIVPEGCGSCLCVDHGKTGCSCRVGASGTPSSAPALALLALGLARRRRRRR